MGETRKLAAILVADVVGYSRLAAADEDRTLSRLRELRSDLIDPPIAVYNGRVVKRTGDGSIVEFRQRRRRRALRHRSALAWKRPQVLGFSRIELELRCVRMGAVWAARDFKPGAGRPSSAGMAPIFYPRTSTMRGD